MSEKQDIRSFWNPNPRLGEAAQKEHLTGTLYGPTGFGRVGGKPGEQSLYKPLRNAEEGVRVFHTSARLAGVSFSPVA